VTFTVAIIAVALGLVATLPEEPCLGAAGALGLIVMASVALLRI
jgi:hypothetical protein